MNNLEEAAALLENGWCVGDLVRDKDTYCAVGAVAAVTGIMATYDFDNEIDEGTTYENFDKIPEARALAQEIIESEWFEKMKVTNYRFADGLLISFENGSYSEVAFAFNDMQNNKEDVIEMFKYAAKRM